jgi:hypothetical protein
MVKESYLATVIGIGQGGKKYAVEIPDEVRDVLRIAKGDQVRVTINTDLSEES